MGFGHLHLVWSPHLSFQHHGLTQNSDEPGLDGNSVEQGYDRDAYHPGLSRRTDDDPPAAYQ